MSWTWQGRQLTKAVKDKTVTFTYDSEGIRTSKTVGSTTTKYLLNGTQILAQTTNGITTSFFYDQQGNRVAMADSSNHFYYYIYNLQGDVIALADASTGKLAATYTYDAWGKLVKLEDSTANSVGTLNPFRYRGYYYDTETSLYYLQTRYYDPDTGRFINADAFTSTDISGVLSTNMFAYCENNPVVRDDQTGEIFDTVLDLISLASSISDVIANPGSVSCWLALGADAVCLAVPGLSGGGVAVKALSKTDAVLDTAKSVYKLADKSSNIRKATGSYEIVFNSGKTYVGKGGYKRMLNSAKRYGGDVKSLTWTKASSHREAFINEYKSMCKYGGPNNRTIGNKNSLNKIWSPGRNYYYRDYGRYYSFGGR